MAEALPVAGAAAQEAGVGAEPDAAVGGPQDGVDVVGFAVARQAHRRPGPAVEHGGAVLRAQPEKALRILGEAQHDRLRQPLLGGVEAYRGPPLGERERCRPAAGRPKQEHRDPAGPRTRRRSPRTLPPHRMHSKSTCVEGLCHKLRGKRATASVRFLRVASLEVKEGIGYSSQMKRATLTDTKNNLSALIDQVQHGETILILDRGRPVARLESVLGDGDDPDGQVARLERQGLLRRASAPLPREILMAAAPRPSEGASALAALLDERRNGR